LYAEKRQGGSEKNREKKGRIFRRRDLKKRLKKSNRENANPRVTREAFEFSIEVPGEGAKKDTHPTFRCTCGGELTGKSGSWVSFGGVKQPLASNDRRREGRR